MKIIKIIVTSVVLVYGTMANAALVSVGDSLSSAGVAGAIIGAPDQVLDSMKTNLGQEGFNELQNYVTLAAISTDAGSIASGTRVDSHMIFLNSPGGNITHTGVLWTFSGAILGIMSDKPGALEVASTPQLGNPGTTYPGATFNARGLEPNDSYSLSLGGLGVTNSITVDMLVAQPGDWIRVVTAASAVPVPAAVWLFGTALIGLFGLNKRRKSA